MLEKVAHNSLYLHENNGTKCAHHIRPSWIEDYIRLLYAHMFWDVVVEISWTDRSCEIWRSAAKSQVVQTYPKNNKKKES
jgi:hypothetical protein